MTRRDRVRGFQIQGKRKHPTMMIDGKVVPRTIIPWVLTYNEFPTRRIYCTNGDKRDFRISNLTMSPPRRRQRHSAYRELDVLAATFRLTRSETIGVLIDDKFHSLLNEGEK
jgi:hypothetical protein